MSETNREAVNNDSLDDFFEPVFTDMDASDFAPVTTEKQRLAAKRRRAEQRLEQRRLREELGFYDMEFDEI